MTPPLALLYCVDDDPLALGQLELTLAKIDAPIERRFFGSPKTALAAHKERPADLVISDLRMGSTTGLKLINAMREIAPDAIYMLLSGEADLESALAAVNEANVFRFFTKPARKEALTLGVTEALRERNLQKMRVIAASTLSAVETMNAAIATIDADATIHYSNEPARRLIEESGYFSRAPDGKLKSRNPAETQEFMQFLGAVEHASDQTASRSIFRFEDPETAETVVASIIPFCAEDNDRRLFSIVFADPSRKDITTPERIAAALNLTPSEARVVFGLIVGGSVDEAATIAGVSLSSARTYLKNVFSKTGVSKQAELVRLVMLAAA